MTDIAIHPTEPLAIISGVDTKPSHGVVICDLLTGDVVVPSALSKTIYQRLISPLGMFEVDGYDIRSGQRLWGCRGKDGSFFEFWGPEVLLGHAFSSETLLMGGLNGKLSLIHFPSRTYRDDILRRSDPILFGPMCYCHGSNSFRVVVRLDDRPESQVLDIGTDGRSIRQLCSINEDVIGIYFGDGNRICCESGEIYNAITGVLEETLDFDGMLGTSM